MLPDEQLGNEDLIAESYQGIRPAPGYPRLPGSSGKRLDLPATGGGEAFGTAAHRVQSHDAICRGQWLLFCSS